MYCRSAAPNPNMPLFKARMFHINELSPMSKRITFLLTVFFISFASFAQRAKYNFNSDWKVFVGDPQNAEQPGFDDASWKPVTLPYAWNEDEAFRKDIRDLSTGIAWYRKKFKLPKTISNVHKI